MANQGNLQDLIRGRIGTQEESIAAQKEKLNQLMSQPKQKDLTALMMMADAMGDKPMGLAQTYQALKPRDNSIKAQALQQQLMQQEQGLTGDYMDLLKLQQKKDGSTNTSASIFQKKKMEVLGKNAADFLSKTRDQLTSNLPKVQYALSVMEKHPDLTGTGIAPVAGSKGWEIWNTQGKIAEENMQSAITDTLRPTLGAQFTEKEGERVMNLTFNPKLPTSENIRRAKALELVIENKVKFQTDLYQHLAIHGDDRNFDYAKYQMRKVGEKSTEKKAAPKLETGTVKGGYEFLGGDPADQNNWRKQ